MRIIGGTARGKRLVGFSGNSIRPTPDKVRGAIFSILFSRIGSFDGKKVLDLCAGTGAMAIEALSRGAAHAWLVDSGTQSGRIIPANLSACRLEARATFMRVDVGKAMRLIESERPFDVIFLDPPYSQNLVPEFLEGIFRCGLLAKDGIVCAEAAASDPIPSSVGNLKHDMSRRYGSTTIHLFVPFETEEYPQ